MRSQCVVSLRHTGSGVSVVSVSARAVYCGQMASLHLSVPNPVRHAGTLAVLTCVTGHGPFWPYVLLRPFRPDSLSLTLGS